MRKLFRFFRGFFTSSHAASLSLSSLHSSDSSPLSLPHDYVRQPRQLGRLRPAVCPSGRPNSENGNDGWHSGEWLARRVCEQVLPDASHRRPPQRPQPGPFKLKLHFQRFVHRQGCNIHGPQLSRTTSFRIIGTLLFHPSLPLPSRRTEG